MIAADYRNRLFVFLPSVDIPGRGFWEATLVDIGRSVTTYPITFYCVFPKHILLDYLVPVYKLIPMVLLSPLRKLNVLSSCNKGSWLHGADKNKYWWHKFGKYFSYGMALVVIGCGWDIEIPATILLQSSNTLAIKFRYSSHTMCALHGNLP